MKRFLAILLIICSLFSLVACKDKTGAPDSGKGGSTKKEYETKSKTISTVYFNTVSSVIACGETDVANLEKYATIADEVLKYYHELFDIYFEYSGKNNIRTINKNAGKSAVTVDAEMIDFLEYCKELYTKTNGKTNVMLGSVLKLWHECREDAMDDFGYLNPIDLPTSSELETANQYTSMDMLVIDREASSVYITHKKASIDVGSIAKGYAVDKLVNRLKAEGATSVALNIGGNIRTIGLKPDGEKWVSGITNPDKSSDESLFCRVRIGASSIVTSGDYERFFYAGNTKYHHIIDPATLQPARYFSAISIITESSALGDALSTALFCMSYEEGLALVNSIGGVEVIWVDLNYNVTSTPGIDFVK